WELACYAGFLVGREAARYMLKRGHGTILFTGATASIRGSNGFAAFSSAKFGLRAVAQAMARARGPAKEGGAGNICKGVPRRQPDQDALDCGRLLVRSSSGQGRLDPRTGSASLR